MFGKIKHCLIIVYSLTKSIYVHNLTEMHLTVFNGGLIKQKLYMYVSGKLYIGIKLFKIKETVFFV